MSEALAPFFVTARVAGLATLCVVLLGLPAARGLVLLQRRGGAAARLGAALEVIALLPLVLPPTTLGYFLLVALGRRSPIGAFLAGIGHPLVFSLGGAVIAAACAAFPLFLEPARAAFAAVDPSVENAARLLGAPERFVFRHIAIPLALPGLGAGAVLAFARAVGDFGTTLMVAGAIPGQTETVSIAIWEAVQAGEESRALTLAVSISLFSVTALAAGRMLVRRMRG
jgi:molybdate transport system permease protein